MKKLWKNVIAFVLILTLVGTSPIFAMASEIASAQEPTLVSTQEAKVTASYSMFKVAENAKLNTYSDGSMTAEITYTGTSFLKMYLGKAQDAASATEGIYEAQAVGDDYVYTIPISALDTAIDAAVLSSKGSWKDNTITISVVQEPTPEPEPDSNIPADGIYTIDVTSSASMFKVVACQLTVKDSVMTAEITLSGTGYDYLFMGTGTEAEVAGNTNWIEYKTDEEGKYTFSIPVEALDKGIAVAAHSAKNNKWYDRTLTFNASTLQEYKYVPADGIYTMDVSSSASMFKVVACQLTVKDGAMTALITLSGTGYDYLFMGTGAEAEIAGSTSWIEYKADVAGKYTFTIPIEELDKGIAVASHSAKNSKWFDRTLTFHSETLKPWTTDGSADNETTGGNGDNSTTEGNNSNVNPDKPNNGVTSEDEIKNMIENTQKGTVADGTYTPSFGYTGGTGRVTISCNKVVVKNGKSTATIVFSSSNYTYAKVNGVKYYNENKGGNSTFSIPVNLNGTTTIAAETTAMGNPYEVEYVLYVYVDGTNVSEIKSEVTYDNEDSQETEEQENTEEIVEDTKEEENSWGDFGSAQNSKKEETNDVNNEKTSAISPVKVAVGVGIAAVVVAAGVAIGFALKKKRG